MKMSVRPLACQLRVFQRRHSEKHFSRVLPTRWRQKPAGIEITSLSPLCMLQVEPEALFQLLLALSQKCSDDLHILDLVEGDQPLMPLVGWLPVVIASLHCVYCWVCEWKKIQNRWIFGRVTSKSVVSASEATATRRFANFVLYRIILSHALCAPGQHTAKRRRKCTRQSRSWL